MCWQRPGAGLEFAGPPRCQPSLPRTPSCHPAHLITPLEPALPCSVPSAKQSCPRDLAWTLHQHPKWMMGRGPREARPYLPMALALYWAWHWRPGFRPTHSCPLAINSPGQSQCLPSSLDVLSSQPVPGLCWHKPGFCIRLLAASSTLSLETVPLFLSRVLDVLTTRNQISISIFWLIDKDPSFLSPWAQVFSPIDQKILLSIY